MVTIQGTVSGDVQGVGFRYFIKRHAKNANVIGYAKNLPNKSVEFLLQGEKKDVNTVIEEIKAGPSFSNVEQVDIKERSEVNTLYSFEIV